MVLVFICQVCRMVLIKCCVCLCLHFLDIEGLEREKAEELQKKWAFNKIVSDKISLWRSLSDMRSGQCKALNYVHSSLPSSSVVIIFNNGQ